MSWLVGCAPASAPAPAPAPPVATVAPTAEVAPATEARITTLKLADGHWAPFTDDEGKPRIALDLVREALGRAGVQVQTTFVGPGELTAQLEKGAFDGSEALWKSPEREAYLYYSEPYLQNRLVLVARKGTKVTASDIEQLGGKKIGIVTDYAYGPEILDAQGVKLVKGDSDEQNLRALLRGELDYIVVDDLLVHQLFESEPKKSAKLLAVGAHPIVLQGLHLALRKDYPGALDILQRFNQQIASLRRDGSYNRILNVRWIVTDADGDGRDELVLAGNQAGQLAPSHRYQLFGAPAEGAPRILIEGEIYQDWAAVPDRFKIPPDPLSTQPSMQAVLVEF